MLSLEIYIQNCVGTLVQDSVALAGFQFSPYCACLMDGCLRFFAISAIIRFCENLRT